ERSVRLWDVAKDREAGRLEWGTAPKDNAYHECHVVFSPDGRYLACAGYWQEKVNVSDGTIHVWEVATGKRVREFRNLAATVWSGAFTPDSKTVVAGMGGEVPTVREWDLESGKRRRDWAGHAGGTFAVAVSPDGKRVVSGGGDRLLRRWDLTTGKGLP